MDRSGTAPSARRGPSTSTGQFTGGFEGSGFTALLIQTDGLPESVPMVGVDLDVDDNGFDVPNGPRRVDDFGFHWLFAEANEALDGRTYSPLTFGFETTADFPDFDPADHIPEGGTYVYLGLAGARGRIHRPVGQLDGARSVGLARVEPHRPPRTGRVYQRGRFPSIGRAAPAHRPRRRRGQPIRALWHESYEHVRRAELSVECALALPGDFDDDGDVDHDDLATNGFRDSHAATSTATTSSSGSRIWG